MESVGSLIKNAFLYTALLRFRYVYMADEGVIGHIYTSFNLTNLGNRSGEDMVVQAGSPSTSPMSYTLRLLVC